MKKCCCITTIIIFVLIIAIICVALFVITPNMLGLGETVISGDKTLNELGLGDVTIYEILKTMVTLTSEADAEKVLGDNAYKDADLSSAQSNLGLPKKEDGKVDYSAILDGASINNTGASVTLSDKEFAAVANDILDYIVDSQGDESDGALDVLENVNIYQLSPKVATGGKVELTTTVGLSVQDLLDQSGSEGDALTDVLKSLPEEMILTMTIPLEETADGYVFRDDEEVKNVKINGQEMDIVNDLINGLEMGEGEEKQTISDMLHGTIGEQLSNFMNDWGVTLGDSTVTIAPAL